MKDFKYKVTAACRHSAREWLKAYVWAANEFGGSNFTVNGLDWRFLNEDNAAWFALKWA